MSNVIVAANMDYLINYAKQQFSRHFGLHLNSADWGPYIWTSDATFYKFLANGVIQFRTKTKPYDGKDNHKYRQVVRLAQQRLIQPSLLILFLLQIPQDDIIEFISLFFSHTRVELFCNCPALKYWGGKYNLTKINSMYGPREYRVPNIRDPQQKNFVCKHLWMILLKYETEIRGFAKFVIPYYRRALGVATPSSVLRLTKQLGPVEIKKLVSKSMTTIAKTRSQELINEYKSLIDGKIDELLNLSDVANKMQKMKVDVKRSGTTSVKPSTTENKTQRQTPSAQTRQMTDNTNTPNVDNNNQGDTI